MEKPVENVDNSQVRAVSPGLQKLLCQLMLKTAGFYSVDMCISWESSENNPRFCEKHRNFSFTFGQTYGIIKKLA